jgi:RNA polymerase sigma factor (sigma-70 family)
MPVAPSSTFMNEQRRLPRTLRILRLHHGPDILDPLDDRVVEREAIRDALARLRPRQRAAIVLRYYEDLEHAEIAALLACSESTVRSTLTRARSALRAELAEAEATQSGDHR